MARRVPAVSDCPPQTGSSLDVPHAAQKNIGVLHFQGGEGTTQCVLGPALRIGLNRILEEAVESDEQFGIRGAMIEVTHKICGLGDEIVIAMRQCLAQRLYAGIRALLAKRIKGTQVALRNCACQP